jgi:hypothetical protein
VCQGTDQQVRVRANPPLPGRVRQLKPVELDLLARRVRDDRDIPTPGRLARIAVRSDVIPAKRPGEGRVAALIAQFHDLVEQGARPQMRIIGQPLTAVVQERHERIRRLTAPAGLHLAVQIRPDRLAISPQMPGDRRDRPSLTTQSMRVHVFLPREHPGLRTGRPSSTRRLSTTRRHQFDTPDKITQ